MRIVVSIGGSVLAPDRSAERVGAHADAIASIETAAGSKAPVDLLAAKVIERSGLRAVVLDGTDPSRVTDAVAGDVDGTDVVPDD